MPQHDWQEVRLFGVLVARVCNDCEVMQDRRPTSGAGDRWEPWVSQICPGDGRDSSRRKRPTPSGSGERTRELEFA